MVRNLKLVFAILAVSVLIGESNGRRLRRQNVAQARNVIPIAPVTLVPAPVSSPVTLVPAPVSSPVTLVPAQVPVGQEAQLSQAPAGALQPVQTPVQPLGKQSTLIPQVAQVVQQVPQVVSQVSPVASQLPEVVQQVPQVVQQVPQVVQQVPQLVPQLSQVVSQVPQVAPQVPQVASQLSQVVQQVPQAAPQQIQPIGTQQVVQSTPPVPQVKILPQQLPVQQIEVLAPAAGIPNRNTALLQAPEQPQFSNPIWRQLFSPKRAFAPGFEAKPIPAEQIHAPGKPDVQFIGAEQPQQQLAPFVPQQQSDQNLAVIRPQEEQQSKNIQLKLIAIPQPSQEGSQDGQDIRQRIQELSAQGQRNNAARDLAAFLAQFNVTGNKVAAREFIRQLKNLTEFQEKQPFANVDLIKALINAEITLAVDNWIINEEIGGEVAATFNIPRDSVSSSIVLTPADIDEMHFAGNNPTAAKKFHVQLQELLWQKVDRQYRVTSDLLSTLSDAMLGLLVGNGVVKEKFADDIATQFYRPNIRKIRLF